MRGDGAKYAILKEEDESGVIVNINSTWAIATAAHVVTKIARSSGVRVIFPGRQSDLAPRPVAAREYHRPARLAAGNTRSWCHSSDLSNYETYDDVLEQLPHFIEEVYNKNRLHSGLGYLPPEEYEMTIEQKKLLIALPSNPGEKSPA
jgi:hypothetical protein